MTGRRYGPHRPEDNPAGVTVLRVVNRVRRETQEPYPAALARQRRALNTYAHERKETP